MKYSLRSLMVVVTLIAIVFGGRVEYSRRMAAYHRQEMEQWFCKIEPRHPVLPGDDDFAAREWVYHGMLWAEYRRAVYRPWIIVCEPSEPAP